MKQLQREGFTINNCSRLQTSTKTFGGFLQGFSCARLPVPVQQYCRLHCSRGRGSPPPASYCTHAVGMRADRLCE